MSVWWLDDLGWPHSHDWQWAGCWPRCLDSPPHGFSSSSWLSLVCSHGGFRVPRRANEDILNASSSCIMFDNVPLDPGVSCYCSVAQSCPTLWDPIDCSLPGSSVHGVLLARILEWVAISYSKVSSWTRDQTCVSCIGRRILYHWTTREAPK